MEVLDLDLDKIDQLVTKMLGHAVMARAYGDAMKRDPQLIGGFGKLRDRHRSAVMTLSGEIERAAASFMEVKGVTLPFPGKARAR